MSGVPKQGHFYCSKSFVNSSWLLYERSCRRYGIKGGLVGICKSRYYAYKLRDVLEKLYRLGAWEKLKRWRFIFVASCLWKSSVYEDALSFALQMLVEFNHDDSKVMSAPIVSNGG